MCLNLISRVKIMVTFEQLRKQKALLKHIETKVKIEDIKLPEKEEIKVIKPKEKKKLKKILKKSYGETLANYLFYLIIFFGYGYIITNKAISIKNSIFNDPNNPYSVVAYSLYEQGTGKIWGIKNPILEMFLGYYLNGLSIKQHFFPQKVDYTNFLGMVQDSLSHFKYLSQYNKGNVLGHQENPYDELNEKQIFIKAIEYEYKKYMNTNTEQDPIFYEDFVTYLVDQILEYYSLPTVYLQDQPVPPKPIIKQRNPRLPKSETYFDKIVKYFAEKPAKRNWLEEEMWKKNNGRKSFFGSGK